MKTPKTKIYKIAMDMVFISFLGGLFFVDGATYRGIITGTVWVFMMLALIAVMALWVIGSKLDNDGITDQEAMTPIKQPTNVWYYMSTMSIIASILAFNGMMVESVLWVFLHGLAYSLMTDVNKKLRIIKENG